MNVDICGSHAGIRRFPSFRRFFDRRFDVDLTPIRAAVLFLCNAFAVLRVFILTEEFKGSRDLR